MVFLRKFDNEKSSLLETTTRLFYISGKALIVFFIHRKSTDYTSFLTIEYAGSVDKVQTPFWLEQRNLQLFSEYLYYDTCIPIETSRTETQ